MKASAFRPASAATALAAGFVAFSTSFVCAADVSAWDRGQYSAARLIAGPATLEQGEQPLRAGVEIMLAPNWKTYWRYPGDSGVPPRFDFSASTNVKAATVLWPAPARFQDGSGTSIGYGTRALFPLRVEPAEAGKPVTLRLKLDYAVCEKLCVPVDAKIEITLPASGTGFQGRLDEAEARVPRRLALGADGPLAIMAVRREGGERVLVDVKTAEAETVELLAEGPTAEWSLPIPEKVAGAPSGQMRFSFRLDGLPSGTSAHGAALTLTAVTPQHAIEVVTHLD